MRDVAVVRALLEPGAVLVPLIALSEGSAPIFDGPDGVEHGTWTSQVIAGATLLAEPVVSPPGLSPAAAIVQMAQAGNFDLIALGWTQQLGPGHDQAVEQVLATATPPVLLLPLEPAGMSRAPALGPQHAAKSQSQMLHGARAGAVPYAARDWRGRRRALAALAVASRRRHDPVGCQEAPMTTSPATTDSVEGHRAEPPTGLPIVVGIDGSEGSIAALHWAAVEARSSDRPLTVINVVASLASFGFPLAPVPGMDEALIASAETNLGTALAAVFGDEHPIWVRRVVARGHPAQVLIEAAQDASLLVVGARGHGVFSLGSVSDRCVHHADCPVVVVRDRGLPVLSTAAGSIGSSTDLPAATGHGSPPPGWLPGTGADLPPDARW